MSIRFSGQALAATIAVAVLTAVICGLAPRFERAEATCRPGWRGNPKGVGAAGGRGRVRAVLVAVQVTLTIVLLVGAGLMMRSLMVLHRVDSAIESRTC